MAEMKSDTKIEIRYQQRNPTSAKKPDIQKANPTSAKKSDVRKEVRLAAIGCCWMLVDAIGC